MARITLDDVDVEYPIYNARTRSLKNRVIALGNSPFRQIVENNSHLLIVQSLKNISMDLRDGDRLALVGRNGAGKSTLLRVLSGICEPVLGTVKIEGSIASMTDISLGMDPEGTGYDNIILRGIFLGMTVRQARNMMPAIAEWTELGAHLERPLRTYSTGMAVRLAFAVSTSIRPDILIMDEMINAGDAHFMDKAKLRLESLIEKTNIMALASHSPDTLRRFCNKAILLHEGRMLNFGGVDEILADYDKLN